MMLDGLRKSAARTFFLISAVAAASCHSVGPVTVTRDRLDYSGAVAESWKHQTLLNIVKLRYSDPPLFVDVGQIVGGYTLETSLNLGVSVGSTSRTETVGGSGRFTDRPTITYQPLTGAEFITGMVVPIAPATLLSSIQAGWPAETILPIGVSAINGITNEDYVSGQYREADGRFARVVELIQQLQADGLVSFRIDRQPDNAATLLRFGQATPDGRAAAAELRNLLGVNDTANEVSIVFGDVARNDEEIALKTRSLLNILQVLSARADLPPAHVEQGRASTGAPGSTDAGLAAFHIRSMTEEPTDAFVAVNYRDTWFYIDDRDLASKRLFSLLMLLFTFADTGGSNAGPVLTIPTG